MRIFYYFQDLETNMFAWQRVHLIDEIQRHGCTVETFNPLYFKTPEEANESALNLIKNEFGNIFNIVTIINDSIKVNECFTNYSTLCERFKFMDDNPFGIKEE